MAALFFAFNTRHDFLTSIWLANIATCNTAEIRKWVFRGKHQREAWHSVAIDEAYKMMINKDLKSAIVRPNKENINRLSLYLSHRLKLWRNLQNQLYQTQLDSDVDKAIYTTHRGTLKRIENIRVMVSGVNERNLLPLTSNDMCALRNPFVNKVATPEQGEDLLNFRKIGQKEFETFITFSFLNQQV